MQWYYNLKIGTKVGCIIALLLVVNIVTAFVAKVTQDQLRQNATELLNRRAVAIQLIDAVTANALAVTALMFETFIINDPKSIQEKLNKTQQLSTRMVDSLLEYQALGLDSYEQEQINLALQTMKSTESPMQESSKCW